MTDATALRDMCGAARTLLRGLGPVASAFAAGFPHDPKPRPVAAHALPVVAALDGIERFAAPATAALVRDVQHMAPALAWRQTYTAADIGGAFLDQYGWTEFLGLRGPLADEQMACGVLLLGPGTEYPAHAHEAEEVYVPLAGAALWRAGDAAWQVRPPCVCIHHASWTPHAMRTLEAPLLALYVWRGGGLAAKSRMVA